MALRRAADFFLAGLRDRRAARSFNDRPIGRARPRDLRPLWPGSSCNPPSNAGEWLARTTRSCSGTCLAALAEVLLDHLVGARKQQGRHVEAERLGGLE